MAMGCENCTRTYNSEFFDSIDADSSDVEFQQIIISQLHLPLESCCTN